MTDPKTAATTYFQAWKAKDFVTLRSLLADTVTFRGPLGAADGAADGADECLRGLEGMSSMITDIVIDRMFVDGSDVLTWYDLHTSQAAPIATVNWSHLENGRIATIRAIFDPRPLLGGGA